MSLESILSKAIELNSSDIHLSSGFSPLFRIHGYLSQTNFSPLSQQEIEHYIFPLLNPLCEKKFQHENTVDFAFEIQNLGRFRCNLFQQMRGLSVAIRVIPQTLLTLAQLGFESIFSKLTEKTQGLILVTGATGSGKSTTLSALIDHINRYQAHHIITLEDPIEYMHIPKKALIHQRELGRDTKNFHDGLRSILRQDPDVILIGEMRDSESIRLALTAAETGHLVFSTLHSNSAAKTIHRITDTFSGEEKVAIQILLAQNIEAIISQELIQNQEGSLLAAFEILLATPAIRHLISENKISQIESVMQTQNAMGMQTRTQHIEKLVKTGVIACKNTIGKNT